MWLLDEASQHIPQANACAERLTGLSAAAMRGRSVLDLASTPQELAFWSEPVDVIAQGVTAHTSLLRADGSLVPVQRLCPACCHGEGGSTVLLLTMLDRSLQETTERELETLLSELRATLDSAADGMLVCGLDRRVRAFNQRLAQLWNLPPSCWWSATMRRCTPHGRPGVGPPASMPSAWQPSTVSPCR